MASASSRRATNSRASCEGGSSWWASSMIRQSGDTSLRWLSRVSSPAPTAKRSAASPGDNARATPSASAWGGGRWARSACVRRSSWARPAKGRSRSGSVPVTLSTWMSSALARTWSSRAVFPIPASPVTISTPLWPSRAPANKASSRCRSASRPTNIPRVLPARLGRMYRVRLVTGPGSTPDQEDTQGSGDTPPGAPPDAPRPRSNRRWTQRQLRRPERTGPPR